MPEENLQKKIEQIEKGQEKPPDQEIKEPSPEGDIVPELKETAEESLKESKPEDIVAGVEVAQAQEQRYKEVEKILEDEEMKEKYKNLPSFERKEFESAGENIARQINNLLEEARVDVPKITDLVKEWQANIPSTDEYFKQEVKNKVDKIMDLLKEQ